MLKRRSDLVPVALEHSDKPFYDKALPLLAKGICPIPCNGKQPLVPNWQSYSHQLASRDRVEGWRIDYPTANIGAVMGIEVVPGFSLVCLDIDDERYVDPVLCLLGNDAFCAKAGKKGLGIFVLVPTELVKTQRLKPQVGGKAVIEILGQKSQTILPPSVHPDTGEPYSWLHESLYVCDLALLQQLSADLLWLLEFIGTSPDVAAVINNQPTHEALKKIVISGLLGKFPDEDSVFIFLSTLFPPDYDGDENGAKLRDIIRWGFEHGFHQRRGFTYAPGDVGPVPLGVTQEHYFVFKDQRLKTLKQTTAVELQSPAFLRGLAPSEFWGKQFPSDIAAFNAVAAGESLIEECRQRGAFVASRVRGRGTWLENGEVVLNLGGELPASAKHCYVCFDPLGELGTDNVDAEKVWEWLRLFNWRHSADATFVLGWLACAPVCGTLGWRPHLFMHGPRNTGKTTIIHTLGDLLKPLVLLYDGNSTEAGIRQTVKADSLPVVLDEFESDHDQRKLGMIIKLARSASSADYMMARGTPEGKALTFSLNIAFLFAAINPIALSAADESRIVQVELLKHGSESEMEAKIKEGKVAFRDAGPDWCGMMVGRVQMLQPAIDVLETAMPPCESRHRRNMATLLAGAYLALNGEVPTAKQAAKWVKKHEEAIVRHAEAHQGDDALDCLQYLIGFVVEGKMLGDWLLEDASLLRKGIPGVARESLRMLANYGIRVEDGHFFVANQSPNVERIYSTTKYGMGAWRKALRKVEGAEVPLNPQSFGPLGKQRCVKLPLSLLGEPTPPAKVNSNF